ncbi:MAG: hypothetical protein IPH88_02140 [Bacteroidales bacterium]|nr:hypothetical protein [Bacteroidales bacterium]
MIKYLENRIWSLNARIMQTEGDAAAVNQKLNQLLSGGIFADGGIQFAWSDNPIGNYSFRSKEILLSFTPVSLHRFQEKLNQQESPLKISSFSLIINSFGFLNILPVYEYSAEDTNVSSIEAAGDAAAELVDGLFDEMSGLMDALHEIGIIRKSDFYHFGVPSGLEKHGSHTKDDSYNYLVHILFIDEKSELESAVKLYEAEDRSMTYEEFRVYSIFPIYFWEMEKSLPDSELLKLVAIDSYMICETVAVNTSLHVYNAFLDALNQNIDVDSNHLRKIFNYNTWQIQNLRLFNPNFTLHQFRFMKMYRENSDIQSKYDLFKDAEQSLTFAIEGMEVSRTQQSERVMQFILALFTALTLYSVITDVYSLITSNVDSVPFSLHSMQSIIFILETLVILFFILFFRKISKRM